MREIVEYTWNEMFENDIEDVMSYIKNEAHQMSQWCSDGSYNEEPACEKFSDEWMSRVRECIAETFGKYVDMYEDQRTRYYEVVENIVEHEEDC